MRGDAVAAALFDRRILLVTGQLDPEKAGEVAAALMTLDGLGDGHVELRLGTPGGDIEAGLLLIDVIDLLGVPVHTVAMGLVGGGAVGVLAVGAQRRMAGHARLQLRAPDLAVGGRALDIERALAEEASRRDAFTGRLARATGRPAGEVEAQWSQGRFLGAEDAVTLGYVDGVGA